jgi:hippurate hydrolase
MIIERMEAIATGIATAMGGSAELRYRRGYPVTINHADNAEYAAQAAAAVIGQEQVLRNIDPVMGAEDFSYMLNERPGCYVWLGQGGQVGGEGALHHPRYNFNDEALPIGASYFANLVEQRLGRAA